MALLCNPSIRKSILVDLPTRADGVGFGVCPVTNDPKIMSITQSSLSESDIETKINLYTLSSGKWRSLSTNLPTELTQVPEDWSSVTTDRFIYWIVGRSPNMILSFDVTHEIFEVIKLPDSVARDPFERLSEILLEVIDLPDSVISDPFERLSISKLRDSIAIINYKEDNSGCTVWIMEDGVERSFTNLYTIMKPHDVIVGFRKSGEPIMVVRDDDDDDGDKMSRLVLYEPDSTNNNILEISQSFPPFYVNSYMETLLLLGRSDCISY